MKTIKNTKFLLGFAALLLGLAVAAQADILELKNGAVLNGKYVGGTVGTLRFETGGGMQVFETSQIMTITFTTPAGTVAPVAPAPAAPVVAYAPATVTLPAGTTFLVRMVDSISSKNKAGTSFSTELEYDLVVNGVKVVPAGTTIYGKVHSSTQARRLFGKSSLDIRLVQMVPLGSPVPIVTSGYQQAGEASIKKAARGAAAGAAIGAIVDGGDGAGKGAAIGATVLAMKKGETITIPSGTLLEFTLTQPVTVQAGG
jgi:hypothetical protein